MDFSKLVQRVKALLTSPRTEWPVIAQEPATTASLYTGYVLILAAIPAVCAFIKGSLIGYSIPLGGGTYRLDIGSGLGAMIVGYALSLVLVYVLALIIDALAPTFGGQKDRVQALKAAAYAYTASWVAGFGQLLPWVGMLILIAGAIYSIYLLYLGLPSTMKAPADRAAGYTAVTVVIAIVLRWITAIVTGGLLGTAAVLGAGTAGVSAPATGSFDEDSPIGKLEQWSENMEAAGKKMEAAQSSGDQEAQAAAMGEMMAAVMGGGGAEALAPERLRGFVPETLAGLQRTDVSAERSGVMGLQVAMARATYSDDSGQQIQLEITDTGGMGGLMAMAEWAQVEQERQTETGYERTRREGGRIVHEEWDRESKYGKYSTVLGERFVVEASGSAADIAQLKAAVAGLDLSGLEALKGEGVRSE